LEDVFRRWARLGSSEDVVDELEALLRSRETRSAIRYVYAGEGETGEQVTCRLLDGEFWKNYAYPLVDTDSDGVDHIAVHYTDHSLADRTEFFVRAVDAERHEGLYFPALAPPPVSQSVDPQPEAETAIPDSVEIKTDEDLSARQPPQESPKGEDEDGWQVRRVKEALEKTFPPHGRPPIDWTLKEILEGIKPIFEAQSWKLASPDSVGRALRSMGHRA
jgi:hypothetical protein